MGKFNIIDTTLRDGEQTAGVVFTLKEKIVIAKELDKLGIEIIEAGIPAMGIEEINGIKALLNLKLKSEIMTWNRIVEEDIQKSLDCGVKLIHMSAPVSDIHIYKKLNKTKEWVLEQTKKCIKLAIDGGAIVSLGAEDASRADFDFLMEFYNLAKESGVSRIRYADTVSYLDPISTYEVIKKIKEKIDLPIDFHGHNDFGSATGNSLAAIKAGAEYISCSINGLGERAGNTSLEEIIMGTKYVLGIEKNYKLKKLIKISELVEEYSGKKISDTKPIVGKEVFSHESGIHVDGILKNKNTYELFNPKDIGRTRKIIIGKHTGIAGIVNKFKELGYEIEHNQAREVVDTIRKELDINKQLDINYLLNNYSKGLNKIVGG